MRQLKMVSPLSSSVLMSCLLALWVTHKKGSPTQRSACSAEERVPQSLAPPWPAAGKDREQTILCSCGTGWLCPPSHLICGLPGPTRTVGKPTNSQRVIHHRELPERGSHIIENVRAMNNTKYLAKSANQTKTTGPCPCQPPVGLWTRSPALLISVHQTSTNNAAFQERPRAR